MKTEVPLIELYNKQTELYDLSRELETKILETAPQAAPQLIWNPAKGCTEYASKERMLWILEAYVVEVTCLNIKIHAREEKIEKKNRSFWKKFF